MDDVKSYSLDDFQSAFPNTSIYSHIRPLSSKLKKMQIVAPFAAYTILFLVGMAGNAFVAAVIGRLVANWMRGGSSKDTPSGSRGMHVYILGLCLFDLLALICLPLLLMDLAYGQWTIPSSFVCKLFLSGDCLTKFGAPLLLTALSGFCYFSICRGNRAPTTSKFNFDLGSTRVALAIIGFCALVVFVLGAPVWFYGGVHYVVVKKNDTIVVVVPKCYIQTSERVIYAFMAYSCAFGYVLPAALFTYFYSAVLYHVHRHARRMRGKKARYFWRVAKTSMCLVIFYLSCWTPYWGLFLYTHFSRNYAVNILLSYFIHTLPYINCCGYPILYTLLNRNIKDDYDRMAKRSREKKEQSRQMQKSTTWAGKNQQRLHLSNAPESSCGYWSNTNRSNSPDDRSVDTDQRLRGRSPPTPLRIIIDEEE